MNAHPGSLHSGQLARLTGVSADTLRHYERLGILPKALRSTTGYRNYSADAVHRVQLVRRALQLGFTLAELSEILRVRDSGGAPCHRVLRLTEEKLRSLGQQIQELRRTQRYMRQLVREWRKKLANTEPGKSALLLQALKAKPALTATPRAFPNGRRKETMRHLLLIAAVSLTVAASVSAQDTKHDGMAKCSMHAEKEAQDPHYAEVNKHGDLAMGFPHDKTTHHFRLRSDGGAIEITANDSNDKTNTAAIRDHLLLVAGLFGQGDFSTPMFIHDTTPPGIETMRLLKAAIHYRFEELPTGARLSIESSDPVAVAAVHDFLRFQISDHQTGDPITVTDSH